MKSKDTLEIPVWWKHNGMITRRDALSTNHPESDYQYILKQGLIPEEFGIYTEKHYRKKKLLREGFGELSNDQLLDKVTELQLEIESMLQYL